MPSLADLQKNVANATALVSNTLSLAQTALADLNRCNCGKGKVLGQCRPLIRVYTFGETANLADCKAPAQLDACVSDCCSVGTCQNKVNDYNNKLIQYNSAVQSLTTAQTALDNFVKTDPNVLADDAKQKNITMLFIVGVALLVLIGIFFIIRKFVKKK